MRATELPTTEQGPGLTELGAARVFARAMNRANLSLLEQHMADDVVWESPEVSIPLAGREHVARLLGEKFANIAKTPGKYRVFAEMATVPGGARPCVVISQGTRDNLECTVLLTVAAGRIRRIDLGVVPPPATTRRTGEYPR